MTYSDLVLAGAILAVALPALACLVSVVRHERRRKQAMRRILWEPVSSNVLGSRKGK